MATDYSDIYDLFLVSIQDYKIDTLAASTPNLNTYLEGFLIKAISRFDNCNQDLEDRNDTTQIFSITLTTKEKVILSNIMVYEWLLKEIQDIRKLSLNLSDTDFKHYSEAQNLKEKSTYADKAREIFTQDMTNYEIKNIPWTDWNVGTFG